MISEKNLSHEEVLLAILTIKDEICRREKAAVIAVSDSHGEMIGLLHMDGAHYSSIRIASNKAYSASRERKSSFEIGQSARDLTNGFDISYFGDKQFTGWGGGIPVIFDGKVIGAVAVSGLPEKEDMELSQLGVDAIMASINHSFKK